MIPYELFFVTLCIFSIAIEILLLLLIEQRDQIKTLYHVNTNAQIDCLRSLSFYNGSGNMETFRPR